MVHVSNQEEESDKAPFNRYNYVTMHSLFGLMKSYPRTRKERAVCARSKKLAFHACVQEEPVLSCWLGTSGRFVSGNWSRLFFCIGNLIDVAWWYSVSTSGWRRSLRVLLVN